MLEKNDEVGGTWWENPYPGAGVDTPSHLYSFSFAPRAWSTHFGKRDEVQDYLRDVAERVRPAPPDPVRHRGGVGATYDEDAQRWTVTADGPRRPRGARRARTSITAVGQLNRPKLPDRARASTASPARSSTPRAGPTTSTSPASGSPSSAPAPARCRSCRRSRRRPGTSPSSSARRSGSPPTTDYFRRIERGRAPACSSTCRSTAGWYRTRLAWNFNDKVHPTLQVDPGLGAPGALGQRGQRRAPPGLHPLPRAELDGRADLRREGAAGLPALRQADAARQRLVRRAPPRRRRAGHRGRRRGHRRPACAARTASEHEADVVVLAHRLPGAAASSTRSTSRGRVGPARCASCGAPTTPRAYLGITVPGFPNLFLLSRAAHGARPRRQLHHDRRVPGRATSSTCSASMVEQGLGAVEVRAEVHDALQRAGRRRPRAAWSGPTPG